jgi:S1-C subfamily serine protease
MIGKTLKPLYFLGVLVLLISLACGIGGSTPTQAPEAPATTEAPVATQPPTQAPPPTEAPSEVPPTEATSGAVSKLSDVKNAVIQIESQGTFVDPEVGVVLNGAGRGSGFIIDPSGIAVTNNHVVGGAALLKVWVGGESEPRNAKVLGVSECSDLAVIDIEGDGYPYLDWYQGPIDVGMDMYIAGFPLGDPEYSLTQGIISKAKADGETSWASVDSVLEYDATSNPGNSGGPVITPDGKVLAVHYAGDDSARQAFGISRDVATKILDQLESGNSVDSIGVNGQAVSTEDGSLTGIWVSSVQSGSPADKAGVEPADVITMMENLVLATDGTMSQYCDILRSHSPGDTLGLEVVRWPTGELLSGQLNGRELVVTGSFDSGQGSTGSTGTTTGSTYYNPQATESGDTYLSTEFDDTEGWSVFTVPVTDQYEATYQNSRVYLQVNQADTTAYMVYDEFVPADVRVDTSAETIVGTNRNNISLVCRATDQGWYEFSMNSGGLWYIWKYDNGKYTELTRGASKAINMQKASNELTATCIGTELTFFVNQTKMGSVRDNRFKDAGQVGISVSTFDIPNVGVEFDWFVASVP